MIFDIPASADFRQLRVRGKDVNVLLNIVLTKMPEYFGNLSGGLEILEDIVFCFYRTRVRSLGMLVSDSLTN